MHASSFHVLFIFVAFNLYQYKSDSYPAEFTKAVKDTRKESIPCREMQSLRHQGDATLTRANLHGQEEHQITE
jgi:hypothetical protein